MLCGLHKKKLDFRCSIFEISVGWTGTRSIVTAIKILGGIKRNHHFNHCQKCVEDARNKLLLGDCKFFVYRTCDYASNFPHIHWKQLAETFPDAKFIFPRRSVDSWLEKLKRKNKEKIRSHRSYKKTRCNPINYSALARFAFYGQVTFNEFVWRERLQKHEDDILDYFGNSDRLLSINILEEDSKSSWEQLCGFLDKPIPDVPFPHRG